MSGGEVLNEKQQSGPKMKCVVSNRKRKCAFLEEQLVDDKDESVKETSTNKLNSKLLALTFEDSSKISQANEKSTKAISQPILLSKTTKHQTGLKQETAGPFNVRQKSRSEEHTSELQSQ